MPLFEYECRACDGHFEKLTRNINAEPGEVECPGCGSTDTYKVISLFGMTSGSSDSGFGFPGMAGVGGGQAGHAHAPGACST